MPHDGHRLQAAVRRHRLLRDLQPAERRRSSTSSDAPIERITPAGIDAGGVEYEVDAIVFATGFDAMTGALLAHRHPRPRRPERSATTWADGPRTYLGLGVAGFPNLFTITGPGSPSVLTNMIVSIEQHVEWIADCIDVPARPRARRRSRPTPDAAGRVGRVRRTRSPTSRCSRRCNSWYLGANVPGKPRVFMPLVGFPPYVEKCDEVAAKGYEGFVLSG